MKLISKCLRYVLALIIGIATFVVTIANTGSQLIVAALIVILLMSYSLNKLIDQIAKLTVGYKYGRTSRARLLKLLAALMGVFVSTGSLLFMSAFYRSISEGFDYNSAEYLLRSLVCSINLFMLDIEANVLDTVKDCTMLKGLISIQAILSSSCTIAIIVCLVFARVYTFFKLHYRTNITSRNNHLYVFFGINEASKLLAKDIRKQDGEKAIIVFVEKIQLDEEDVNGWDNIVGFFSHKAETFKVARSKNVRVTFSESKLHDIDLDTVKQQENGKYDLLTELNIPDVKRLILQLYGSSDPKLHVFMLSDNEDNNIQDMEMLVKDATIAGLAEKEIFHRFYCHARLKGINRVVEDIAIHNKGLDVRVVDSSHLAVELIKQNGKCRPVDLVKLSEENPTTVESDFNSLIIGFDEVGQDAFRFLYEFAAFVDCSSNENHALRSPFKCVAIDKDMNTIKGAFEAFTPIVKSGGFESVIERNGARYESYIKLVQMDCNSETFFEKYCSGKLHYVVIAIGDEDAGMALAVRIFNYQRIMGHDIKNLRIMVRCYTREKVEMLQKVANHYNNGIEKGESYNVINLFGQPEQIYTYKMIIDDELVNQGKQFQERYRIMKGDDETWQKRRDNLVKSTIDDLRKLRRKESQDLANAVHAQTKLYLLKKAMGDDYDWNDFLLRYFTIDNKPDVTGHYTNIRYTALTDRENEIIRNLAMLEHLRWNASHEMLGYRAPKRTGLHYCDEKTREHNCLISWEELDKESLAVVEADNRECDYKLFDYGTVDTSIFLHKEELINGNVR